MGAYILGGACVLILIGCAFARKDKSCEPKSCANCKKGEVRPVLFSCDECIQYRELPYWRPEE